MKKNLALLIAFLMFLCAIGNVGATSDYERDLLSALSIMEGDPNGDMRYEDNVSRAETAKIVVATSAYRDFLEKEGASSPFLDVPYTHWASPYISVGVKNGLFKGYFDATFKPSNTVLFEEATVMFLRVLGYNDEDFGTDWPYDQIEQAKNIGLLDNVNKTIGEKLTRRDISALAYNTLMSYPKGSETTHLSAFKKIVGPKTVLSPDWYTEFGADASIIVVRDGKRASLSDVQVNDIAYYMEEFGTALIYTDKVSGIYESATPNKDAPTSVTVSGTTYKLEGVTAFSKLSSGGFLHYGDQVTLLLGRNGEIADVVTNAQPQDKVYGFLSYAGTKETTVSGKTVTKPYAKVVFPSGEEAEYITNKNYKSMVNNVVSVEFVSGVATISACTQNHNISGEFFWDTNAYAIGGQTLSKDVKIIETTTITSSETATVSAVFPQRLKGTRLSADDILYASKNTAGAIESLILHDVTKDTYTYGIITKAKNLSNEFLLSGNYEYIANGTENALLTQNRTFRVSTGQVVQIKSNGKEITSISPLHQLSATKVTAVSGLNITLDKKTYTMSDKVQIYVKELTTPPTYTMITIDEFEELADTYQAFVYTDSANQDGGRVRIIILTPKHSS